MIGPYVEQDNLWKNTEAMEQVGSLPAPKGTADPATGNCTPYPGSWPPEAQYDYPWDCSGRYLGLSAIEKVFACPSDSRTLQQETTAFELGTTVALSSYLGVSGPDLFVWSNGAPPFSTPTGVSLTVAQPDLPGILIATDKYDFLNGGGRESTFSNSGARMADITDGTSNTLLVGERPPNSTMDFGWLYAGSGQTGDGSGDVHLGVNEYNMQSSGIPPPAACPVGPYFFQSGQINNPCDNFHFWSLHSGGANFLFGDASVHFLNYSIANNTLRAMSTKAGGEVVETP
jgi:prepilin-type processing-associated H-X9-DG protein